MVVLTRDLPDDGLEAGDVGVVMLVHEGRDGVPHALIAEIRAARPDLTEGALRQEVFLLCYGDEFSPEQRERILAAIAAYWERKEAGR